MKKINIYHVSILFIAVVLALAQFVFNRSLWHDEANLAFNIVTKTPYELCFPLVSHQSAPVAFLQVEKLFSLIIPNSEHGLRMFPLLCFCASLVLFSRICDILVRHKAVAVAALSLFVFNPALLYFSNEVKQYGVDVFFACLVLWLTVRPFAYETRRFVWLGLAGSIAVYFSNAAPFVLAGVGVYLLIKCTGKPHALKGRRLPIVALGIVWLCAFGLYYFFFADRSKDTMEFMLEFWSRADPAFMLRQDTFRECLVAFVRQGAGSLIIFFGFIPSIAFVSLCSPGGIFVVFRRRDIKLAALLFVPVLAHFAASSLMLYPFAPRMLLYTIPCILLFAAFFLDWVCDRLPGDRQAGRALRSIIAIGVPAVALLLQLSAFPIQRNELKQSMKYVESRMKVETDRIFVDTTAWAAFSYYARTGFLSDAFLSATVNNTADFSDGFLEFPCCTSNPRGHIWLISANNDLVSMIPRTKLNAPLNRMLVSYKKNNTEGGVLQERDNAMRNHLVEFHKARLLDEFRAVGTSARLWDFPEGDAESH